jgi:2,4-dienoyl-CoA reductase-like NADH-dependent reductase (Old Yellow Enzyme family)
MAPLTRNRAGSGLVPGDLAVEYYAQRATAGLIIAEATQISAQAQGYADTPGCYTDDQVAGWKKVTNAVHAKGGTMVVQLWHTGRVSHTSFQKDGHAPVGPSAVRANTKTFVAGLGFVDVSTPRALALDEIPGIIEDFRHASTRAMEAGFDYVALHDQYDGVWMVNNGYDRAMAIDAVTSGRADLVSFGRLFIANPDLVARLSEDGSLNALMDPTTFYGGGGHGYIDYPTLGDCRASASVAGKVAAA